MILKFIVSPAKKSWNRRLGEVHFRKNIIIRYRMDGTKEIFYLSTYLYLPQNTRFEHITGHEFEALIKVVRELDVRPM